MRISCLSLLAAVVSLFVGNVASAFSAPPTVPAGEFPRPLRALLQAAEWDATVLGPLLVVLPMESPPVMMPLPASRIDLALVAKSAKMRRVSSGRVTTLVPHTMTVINTRPGKPDLFARLYPRDIAMVLLASFTSAQWQMVGSDKGIGIRDLTEEQRLIWSRIIPERTRVQKAHLPFNTRSTHAELWQQRYGQEEITVSPRAKGRLRLNKRINIDFYRTDNNSLEWLDADPYRLPRKDGDIAYCLPDLTARTPQEPANTIFGNRVLKVEPRRLKIGAVDFHSRNLHKSISLTGLSKTPTIGEILRRITKETRTEYIADRRIRDLPVYLRGTSAPAGDLLMALCWDVAGTFRKIEPGDEKDTDSLFLLTDDVTGIGTRAGRFAEWGELADQRSAWMTFTAPKIAAKNKPLQYLKFAPDDPFALTNSQDKALVEFGDSWSEPPDVRTSDLSPALRQFISRFALERSKDEKKVVPDRVRIDETLSAYLLLPEISGKAVEVPDLINTFYVRGLYSREIGSDPSKESAAAPAAAASDSQSYSRPTGFTGAALKDQGRIVLVRTFDPLEAARIVRAAAGRSITEVHFEISLADPKAAARLLTAATKAADKTPEGAGRVAVGAVIRLLKGGGLSGEPERNILGMTGETYHRRSAAIFEANKHDREAYILHLSGFDGWIAPSPAVIAEMYRRVRIVADVPGLSCLTFRATGAPGWMGQADDSGYRLMTNRTFGYTPNVRRAFLRASGIDPVDIPDFAMPFRDVARGISWDLGYFWQDDGYPLEAWREFRRRRNAEMLAGLFRAVRKDHPHMVFYTDDRFSSFTPTNTSWFGSWDAPERAADDSTPISAEGTILQEARRNSKRVFAYWGWNWWNPPYGADPMSPESFAASVSVYARYKRPPDWDGLVIDLSLVSGSSAVRLLHGLPETSGREQ
jgi:hypothetical protein